MKSLVWFRNDLRMDDNPALREACKSSEEVHAIYIYSQNQNTEHNEANCKIDFFIENLKDLEESLSKVNIPLTIINSDGFDDNPGIINKYIENNSIEMVFWNNQFGADEINRDESVKDFLQYKSIEIKTFDEQVVFEPGSILTGEGRPYSVFTPFKRKWIEKFTLDLLDIEFKYTEKKLTKIKSNINDLRTYGKLPPLIKGYLRIGGKVSHDCFVDYKFNTIDLCVIVKTDNIDEKYKKKYLN